MESGLRAAAAGPRAFRVLIVTNEAADRAFFGRLLRQKGYDSVMAAGGVEAIAVAEAGPPFDLLITDLVMPGIGGDELARRLRRADASLKILYLTEPSDGLFAERTSLWEDEAFLDKPVTIQGLFEAVALLLVGGLPAPRAVRVRIPGARVRFANRLANLVSLSLTGALIDALEEVPTGCPWPLVLELPSETIHVTGRVVSCGPPAVPPDGTVLQAPYVVALAFVAPSNGVRRALQRVVQQAH